MGNKNKPKSLSWEDFQSLGNPENAPEIPEEKNSGEALDITAFKVRVYLERKQRGGKTASIIKGILEPEDALIALSKKLKSKLGVGGSVKNNEIIIQGDQRKKIIEFLLTKGYKNTKNAGA